MLPSVGQVIVRGVLGVVAVLVLGACSSGNDSTGAPTSTSVSTPEMPVEPSGLPLNPSTTPTAAAPTTTPLPTAKDGTNYAACTDGNCEVLVRKAATLTIDGEKVRVTVADGWIELTNRTRPGGNGFEVSVRGSGVSSWTSNGGPVHTVATKSAEGTTGVLILRTRG